MSSCAAHHLFLLDFIIRLFSLPLLIINIIIIVIVVIITIVINIITIIFIIIIIVLIMKVYLYQPTRFIFSFWLFFPSGVH